MYIVLFVLSIKDEIYSLEPFICFTHARLHDYIIKSSIASHIETITSKYTIRYDTIRDAILTNMSQLNLPHGANN